jgi:hypothetical protein
VRKAANGRSSIHRCADGSGWEGWVSLGIHPVSGKRWRRHVRAATKAQVAGKITAMEKARDAGALAVDRESTLDAWLEGWLAGRVAFGLRHNSISAYRTDLKYIGYGLVTVRAQLRYDLSDHRRFRPRC